MKGHALQVAEDRKRAAHNANCAAAGVVFLPIAVEALGGWSEETVFHISKIGRLMGQRLGLPPNETTKHIFQRLAICLWKGNPLLWSHQFPPPAAWVDGNI